MKFYPTDEPLPPGTFASVEMMTPIWRSPIRLSKRTWEDKSKKPFDWLEAQTYVFVIATRKKHGMWWSFVSLSDRFGWIINEKGTIVS